MGRIIPYIMENKNCFFFDHQPVLYPIFDGSNMFRSTFEPTHLTPRALPSNGKHPPCGCTCPCSRCSDSLLECTSLGSLLVGASYL